jgi:hypothetical protein
MLSDLNFTGPDNLPMPESKTYIPERLPRRGEFSAWALTIVTAFGFYVLSRPVAIPFLAWFFIAVFTFSAASISLGNWMDRHTFIRIEPDGVVFENGLRKTHLPWDAIQEVRTSPSRWGTSVHVIGERAHFSFFTLGEMQFRGRVRARTGFAEGKLILDQIIRAAGLTNMLQDGQSTVYSRP